MSSKALYEFHNLGYAYADMQVLDITAGSIEQNQATAILGVNGSGKSTLLNLLAFLTLPVSGELVFRGEKVDASQLASLRKELAYVQQKPYLFDQTVIENIQLPLKLRGVSGSQQQKIADLMQALDIAHLAERPAQKLSGGEVQKVALARALVTEPKVLILDEPFTHLDSGTSAFLEDFFLTLKKSAEVSLIFSIHDQLKANYLADQMLTLIEGKLLPSAALNLIHGELDVGRSVFISNGIEIVVPNHIEAARHVALDPKQLVLSRQPLDSSMRNQFQGRISAMQEYQDEVRISVDVGVTLHAVITHAALRELGVSPGDSIWISFKSSSLCFF